MRYFLVPMTSRAAVRTRSPALAPAALFALFALSGASSLACAPVRPWERGKLSSPAMEQGLGERGSKGAYKAKVLESKTGGGLPGEAPGGGCGCTQ